MDVCPCSHSMTDVYGIKSYTIAIEPWLLPSGSGSMSPEHTLSVCSPGSSAELTLNALQHPMLTPETLLLCKFLQTYDTAVCQEMEVKRVVRLGKWKTQRGLRERLKLVWRGMWVQQEALQIPVAKETNQQLQIKAERWERNTQLLVLEKTSMANLCSWAQHQWGSLMPASSFGWYTH